MILFSSVVLGELLFGFRSGARFKKNLSDLNRFLAHDAVETVSAGKITADRYSRIAAQLKRQGTPIPTNDIWIAAQTVEHGAELITTDAHFEKISGLVYSRLPWCSNSNDNFSLTWKSLGLTFIWPSHTGLP